MALSARARRQMSKSQFALPGRRYPINTKTRARNALARVSQHGTPRERAIVRRKVARRYKTIKVSGIKKK